MSTNFEKKINQLLATTPKDVVLLSSWLVEQGYSRELLKRYQKSQWLHSVGYGAWALSGSEPDYLGAVYALQNQLGLSIHPAAQTALSLRGKAHYLELASKRVMLMGAKTEKLPSWLIKGAFKSGLPENQKWGVSVDYKSTGFLPPDLGMTNFDAPDFSIKISSSARAILECLYLAANEADMVAAYELLEGLNNLRPDQVQNLLEVCTSVKVKRLFLYLAERAGHAWFKHLDIDRIDMGKGKRSLARGGLFNAKYQITLPKVLSSIEARE